ncbi:MAG: AmmeMemoRadiSam system radical SAM enzyme [Eubacterium sp.]|nr:AmmeMemoRadiSam system radical SAM enzyme [Eubacterium sp.]
MGRCEVCFRHCEIKEGGIGFCGARTCRDGVVVAQNYGQVSAIALDPVEKKPLSRFCPGSRILSVGSYGCNLRCPFCQNSDISWSDLSLSYSQMNEEELEVHGIECFTPEQIANIAERYVPAGNIGVAFTYNEPMIGYEFVRDTAKLIKERGMKNVLVSNGTAELSVLEEILPYIDAMNIDLKGFTDSYYRDLLGGDRRMVMNFIERAVKDSHVELTTLIIPGENDSEEEMRELTKWVASLTDGKGNVIGKNIPLHISRFFPRFHMTDRAATDVSKVYRLADVARENLEFVYTGNC